MNSLALKSAALLGGTFLAAFALAAESKAASVSYTVADIAPASYPSGLTPPSDAPWGADGYPGDSIGFSGASGQIDLAATGVQTIALGTVNWTVNPTWGGSYSEAGWQNFDFAVKFGEAITIDGKTGNLSQSGHLVSTWYTDTLSLNDGHITQLRVDGVTLNVRALATAPVDAGDFGAQAPQTVYAEVVVAGSHGGAVGGVPEPATWSLMLTGFGGLGAIIRRRQSAAMRYALARAA